VCIILPKDCKLVLFLSDFKFAQFIVLYPIKEMFRDVLQQVMETELEETLGYEKSSRIPNNGETGMSKTTETGTQKRRLRHSLAK
jgi:hypothetical protein